MGRDDYETGFTDKVCQMGRNELMWLEITRRNVL